MKTRLSSAEIAALGIPGIPASRKGVEKMASRDGWEFICVAARGGKSGQRREYPLDQPALKQVQLELQRRAARELLNQPLPGSVTSTALVPATARPVTLRPTLTDEDLAPHLTTAQRELLMAKRQVLRAINDLAKVGGLSVAAACRELLDRAQAGLLRPELLAMVQRARSTKGRKAAGGLPSVRVLQRWASDQREGRALAPRPSALPDMRVLPWHALAIELRARPQGSTLTWIHEQMRQLWQPELGQLPSYDSVVRFFKYRYSKGDQLKGRYTGSELRSRTFYQHRSSEGMQPWDEIHADGWTTHFTAPHPVSGEFVTYELWHFHDVATRYLTPMAIGLTENTDVILEGLRECMRFGGVPAIVQTDSTGSVKNAKVEFDPHASISERLGVTFVHPVTVGNSQANGIAENFNTWLDREARELATYQHPQRMDSGTFKKVQKLTRAMVRAADKGERDRQRMAAVRMGKGIVFETHQAAIDWIRSKEDKWNDHPHRSLPKVRNAEGRLEHMTPRQALEAARAAGWEPVTLLDAELVDAFRPHLRKKVTRGTVSPFGGQRYRDSLLDHHEGEEVLVAVDVDDESRVWVKDLDGRLLCVAAFVEATGYRTQSMAEHTKHRRAQAQIRRRERQIEQIQDRMAPPALELSEADELIAAIEQKRVRIPTLQELDAAKQVAEQLFDEEQAATANVMPLLSPAERYVRSITDPETGEIDPIAKYVMERRRQHRNEAAAKEAADLQRIEEAMRRAAMDLDDEEGAAG